MIEALKRQAVVEVESVRMEMKKETAEERKALERRIESLQMQLEVADVQGNDLRSTLGNLAKTRDDLIKSFNQDQVRSLILDPCLLACVTTGDLPVETKGNKAGGRGSEERD